MVEGGLENFGQKLKFLGFFQLRWPLTVISGEQEGVSEKNFSPTGLNNFQPLGLKNHAVRLSIHDFPIVMKYQ